MNKSITSLLGMDAQMLEALVQNKAAVALLLRDPKLQELMQQDVTVVVLEHNPAIIDTSNNALTRVTQRNTS